MPSVPLTIKHNLPFIQVHVACCGQSILIASVLVDTGSDSTCFEADILRPMGIIPALDDVIQMVHGVGGAETVYGGTVDSLVIGDLRLGPVRVDVGRMGYGFGIDAILGMDILDPAGAVIDLPARGIRFNSSGPSGS